METLVERCAGLNVHKDSVTACVRVPDGHGGRRAEIRSFSTTTAGLVLLAEWLTSFRGDRVGMESTSVPVAIAWRSACSGRCGCERPASQRPLGVSGWIEASSMTGRLGRAQPAGKTWPSSQLNSPSFGDGLSVPVSVSWPVPDATRPDGRWT
jgi:hypothetical protein